MASVPSFISLLSRRQWFKKLLKVKIEKMGPKRKRKVLTVEIEKWLQVFWPTTIWPTTICLTAICQNTFGKHTITHIYLVDTRFSRHHSDCQSAVSQIVQQMRHLGKETINHKLNMIRSVRS